MQPGERRSRCLGARPRNIPREGETHEQRRSLGQSKRLVASRPTCWHQAANDTRRANESYSQCRRKLKVTILGMLFVRLTTLGFYA